MNPSASGSSCPPDVVFFFFNLALISTINFRYWKSLPYLLRLPLYSSFIFFS